MESSLPLPWDPTSDLFLFHFSLTELESILFRSLQLLRLPPPVTPYVLRITIDAGTSASRNGILHTNFPLDGKPFERERWSTVK